MTTTPFHAVTDTADRIESYYEQHAEEQLEEASRGERDTIEIDCTELHAFDGALYESVFENCDYDAVVNRFREVAVDYPREDFTEAFDGKEKESVISSSFDSEDDEDTAGESEKEDEPRFDVPDDVDISLMNFPAEARVEIGEPRTDTLNRLIAVRGVVRQASAPKTLVKTAVWECQRCGTHHSVPVEIGNMKQPGVCSNCDIKSVAWERVTAEENHVDFQEIHLQEEPGDAVDESSPRTMTIRIEGTELVDSAQTGERVEVRGVMERIPDDDATLIDGIVRMVDIDSEREDFESLEISDEEAAEFEKLASRRDMEELCVESLGAGDVIGEEQLKQAIVYQLFGGVSHFVDHPDRKTQAGEIHLALIGDPGTSKSTLAEAARDVSPRSVKAAGKGMSTAGMTASATKKEIAGSQEWTLEAGALVLADKGIITIDELDKADDEVQMSLHEALSDQEVSISKAGINVSLPTRVSAMMIANPEYGRFDPLEPKVDQFNLDSALLDRADMVFPLVDEADEDKDGKIARHNLSVGMEGDGSGEVSDGAEAAGLIVDGLLTTESFRRYISYAKSEYEPTMTEAARDELENFYVSIRRNHDDGDVSMSARATDTLRKLAEARARMQLREKITLEDAESVIKMYNEMYKSLGMDPVNDEYRASIADGTRGASERESTKDAIRTAINGLSDYSSGEFATRGEVIEAVESDEEVDAVIDKMLDSGSLYRPEEDTLRTTN